jgi:hypothetical protein
LILFWFLFAELFGKQPDMGGEIESAIGTLDDELKDDQGNELSSKWIENFIQWAGPRLPVSVERVGFTFLWLVFLLSLFDHLVHRSGMTGTLIYFLTILPHEAGHFICSPFGWFLSIAGGSIWQILLFVIFGFVVWFRKRRNEALGWWAISGHSLIALSTYIADASARSLTLIPIPDPSRHDWGNMLEYLGLLKYDWLFALFAIILGGAVVFSASAAGLFFTWYQPIKLLK